MVKRYPDVVATLCVCWVHISHTSVNVSLSFTVASPADTGVNISLWIFGDRAYLLWLKGKLSDQKDGLIWV